MRSKPYARPYASAGTTSARIALRLGPRMPRAAQAPVRSTATCHGAVASPTLLESTAVVTYPPTATFARRSGSSARAPPASLATPAAPSAMPSINPSADAGAPSVTVRKLGSSDVGISWPTSERKLASPIERTPGLNQVEVAVPDPRSVFMRRVCNPTDLPHSGHGRTLRTR